MSKSKLRKEYEGSTQGVTLDHPYEAIGKLIHYEGSTQGVTLDHPYEAIGKLIHYEDSDDGVTLDKRPCSGKKFQSPLRRLYSGCDFRSPNLAPSEFASQEEHKMDWAEAIDTVDEALAFYYEHVRDTPVDTDYDRNDVSTVMRAWQRIQQG